MNETYGVEAGISIVRMNERMVGFQGQEAPFLFRISHVS
jgi:hypothetical protein